MEAERKTAKGWHSPLDLPGLNWSWRRPENLNPVGHHSLRAGGAEGPEEHLRTIRGMSKKHHFQGEKCKKDFMFKWRVHRQESVFNSRDERRQS